MAAASIGAAAAQSTAANRGCPAAVEAVGSVSSRSAARRESAGPRDGAEKMRVIPTRPTVLFRYTCYNIRPEMPYAETGRWVRCALLQLAG
ncbi:MAG: hypothetical protein NVSMB13_06440 [Mycobacteriales bacterium]